MWASCPGDCAAQSKARCLVAAVRPDQQTDFLTKGRSETRLHSIPWHAHGKSDGFRLTSPSTCPHGLVSWNPSDLPCAHNGMLCKRVSEPFVKKSVCWSGLAAAIEQRALL